MISHHSRTYAEIIVQDRLVRYVDSEFYNVLEGHVGGGENNADALEDHLNLFKRALGHRTVQARTNLSIAEKHPGVRGYFRAMRGIVGVRANSIVEHMDLQHGRISPRQSDWARGTWIEKIDPNVAHDAVVSSALNDIVLYAQPAADDHGRVLDVCYREQLGRQACGERSAVP